MSQIAGAHVVMDGISQVFFISADLFFPPKLALKYILCLYVSCLEMLLNWIGIHEQMQD